MTRRDLVALPAAAAALAQSDADVAQSRTSQDATHKRLCEEAAAITDQAIAEIATKDGWEKLRATRRRELRDMLGLEPFPARTPLNVRVRGTVDKGSYRIERISFESLPKFYVTGNLYVPKQREGRVPGIIYVCGHSYSPQGAKAQYQRHGISLAKNGYVCFILDPIQLAETFSLHHGPMFLGTMDWYARGYTPAGPEVWNAIRAIDYLETRPEVDAARIGMTGRSGGAAMTWFTAAVEDRVKVAVPVMGISTYRHNLIHNTQKGHCDCMFPVNFARHCMLHQGALIAPRPLLMAHGIKDALFPVDGYKEFEREIGAMYGRYGVGDAFANIEVDTGHQDSDFLRESAIAWFDKFLWKRPKRQLDMSLDPTPFEQLSVHDGSPPPDARNADVHAWFTDRPRLRNAAGVAPGILLDAKADPVAAIQKAKAADAPRLLYIASPGEDQRTIQLLMRTMTARATIATTMMVFPRGTGASPWPASVVRDMERNAMHVGWTLDSMRLSDVLAALRKLKQVSGGNISVLGKGNAAGLALYAALLDKEIWQAILWDPPASHREGPHFHNVLRHGDLPEIAALLAPRRLSFLGTMPPAYAGVKQAFAKAGAAQSVYAGVNLDGMVTGRFNTNYGSGY